MGFFQGTQERVRNSRGKGAISVRAIEILLYMEKMVLDRDDRQQYILFTVVCNANTLPMVAAGIGNEILHSLGRCE